MPKKEAAFEYEAFTENDQRMYLEIQATQLEARRYQLSVTIDLANATGQDTIANKPIEEAEQELARLTGSIGKLRSMMKELPELDDEAREVIARRIRQGPQRPDRPTRPQHRGPQPA